MQRAVKEFEKSGRLVIMMDTKVVNLERNGSTAAVVGVEVENNKSGERNTFFAKSTILATGGFASDRSGGSYLDVHRPELMGMPATAGEFSTGDGIALATKLGAGVVDMDKIQLHPTGWIDMANENATTKTLAAELMRGVGGVLLNGNGQRFCNEVGTRSYITDSMLKHDEEYAKSGVWNKDRAVPPFYLVLSEEARSAGAKHVDLYVHKGLMQKVVGLKELAEVVGVKEKALKKTYEEYKVDEGKGRDKWGKGVFNGMAEDIKGGNFYVGRVTPVLHYCMGGLVIDEAGKVLLEGEEGGGSGRGGAVVEGLWAAGEVAGGVHGENRLGGNSLLECTVFGRKVGNAVEVVEWKETQGRGGGGGGGGGGEGERRKEKEEKKSITMAELEKHNSKDDCWMALHGTVYDLGEFAEEHPPGAESIWNLCGLEATEVFEAIHNAGMLEDFVNEEVGKLAAVP